MADTAARHQTSLSGIAPVHLEKKTMNMRDPDGAMISAEWLSETIGAIYDCAIDPGLWPAALHKIRTGMHMANATLALQVMPSGRPLLNISEGVSPYWLERMRDYGPEILEQWGGATAIAALPIEEPAVLSRVNPRGISDDFRYYREWGKPQGFNDVLGIILARDDAAFGSLGFGRHESAGPISAHEIAIARLLTPHLQRAATINRLLDAKSIAVTRADALFDSLSVPIVLTGARLEIIHANRAAQALLDAGDLIREKGRVLQARSAGVTRALEAAVAQALQDETAIGRKGFGVPASAGGGAPHAFFVLPLCHGKVRTGIAQEAVAAIFIAQAAPSSTAPADVLAASFDLTPAEARVFVHLAAGGTVGETADALGIGVGTVKSHLSHLFEKTGVNRQADLRALAASFDVPVGRGADSV
jgi:DNA-binding CsgD family transcriptional regulator/PAS domain-containing protein